MNKQRIRIVLAIPTLFALLLTNWLALPVAAVDPVIDGNWIDYAQAITPNEDGVYIVTKPEHLAWVAQQVNDDINEFARQTVQLDDNIDLSGRAWTPIGNVDTGFKGNFEGKGYTISGLYSVTEGISDNTYFYNGLFGQTFSNATDITYIRDFTVTGTVSGGWTAGGIVGALSGVGVVLENVVSKVDVFGNSEAGGVAGSVGNATVINAVSDGTVRGALNAGGIASRTLNARVVNVVNFSTVTAYEPGGILALNDASSIQNAVNLGDVALTDPTKTWYGGLCASNQKQYNASIIENSYWLSGSSDKAIGVGSSDFTTKISSFDSVIGNLNGDLYIGNVKYSKLLDALNAGTIHYNAPGDLPATCFNWAIDPNDSTRLVLVDLDNVWSAHTEEIIPQDDVYIVTKPEHLAWVALQTNIGATDFAGKTIDISADLNLSSHPWVPIGGNLPFAGTINGAGTSIKGLKVTGSDKDSQGLFAAIAQNGSAINLTVSGDVAGENYVGGIAADNAGLIKNCLVNVNLNANNYAGGIAASNSGIIEDCSYTGKVVGKGKAAGIVAKNEGRVGNSYTSGAVSGAEVGGVVAENNSGRVENVYSAGVLTSSTSVGGIIGSNNAELQGGYWLSSTAENGVYSSLSSADELSISSFSGEGNLNSPVTIDGSSHITLLAALDAGTDLYNDTNSNATTWFGWFIDEGASHPNHLKYWIDNTEPVTPVNNVYSIYTAQQLAWIFKQLYTGVNDYENMTVQLENDIDLFELEWLEANQYSGVTFRGTFDGKGNSITGLTINLPTTGTVALFYNVAKDAVVQNFTLNGYININAGSPVVYTNNGMIDNVISDVDINSIHTSAGIVHSNESTGVVQNSAYLGTLTADHSAGIALSNNGTINNCYNAGVINHTSVEDFMAGISISNFGNILNSWSVAQTNNADFFSDLVDSNEKTGVVKNCYYLQDGEVAGIRYSESGATAINVGSFDSATSAITLDSGISNPDNIPHTNLITALNAGVSAYNTANPTAAPATAWMRGYSEDDYPHFVNYWSDFAATTAPTGNEITTPEQLAWLANKVNAGEGAGEYTLGKDIDLSGHMWVPIGNNTNNFTGTFDGGEYKITGLYINTDTSDYQGLFGYVGTAGTVQNVDISGSVTGRGHVGGVAGYNKGNVKNSIGNATVTGTSSVGAVVGNNNGGSITYCIGNASVNSDGTAGGVAGFSRYGIIANSHNNGTVTSTGITVGGVVGNNADGSIVVNSYNSGDVSATGLTPNVGGIAGQSVANANVTNSYNIGNVSAPNQEEGKIGGVVGNNSGAVTGSYYLADNGADNGVGTSADKTTNLGSFSAQSMAITIEGTADNSIPTTSLFTALNAGASAYNATVTPTMKVADMWELVAEKTYPSLTIAKIVGDVTYDGDVNTDDLRAIAGDGYNMETTPENPYDLNGDGKINFADLAMVRNTKIFDK